MLTTAFDVAVGNMSPFWDTCKKSKSTAQVVQETRPIALAYHLPVNDDIRKLIPTRIINRTAATHFTEHTWLGLYDRPARCFIPSLRAAQERSPLPLPPLPRRRHAPSPSRVALT